MRERWLGETEFRAIAQRAAGELFDQPTSENLSKTLAEQCYFGIAERLREFSTEDQVRYITLVLSKTNYPNFQELAQYLCRINALNKQPCLLVDKEVIRNKASEVLTSVGSQQLDIRVVRAVPRRACVLESQLSNNIRNKAGQLSEKIGGQRFGYHADYLAGMCRGALDVSGFVDGDRIILYSLEIGAYNLLLQENPATTETYKQNPGGLMLDLLEMGVGDIRIKKDERELYVCIPGPNGWIPRALRAFKK